METNQTKIDLANKLKIFQTLLFAGCVLGYANEPAMCANEPLNSNSKELVQQILSAHGGEENLRRLYETPCRVTEAVSVNNKSISRTTISVKDKYSTSYSTGEMGFDGKTNWSYMDGKIYKYSKTENSLAPKAISPLEILRSLATNTIRNSHMDAGSESFDKMKFVTELLPDTEICLWANKHNHLIERFDFNSSGQNCTWHLAHYIKTNGCQIAMSQTIYSQGRLIEQIELQHFDCPVDISELRSADSWKPLDVTDTEIPFEWKTGRLIVRGKINGETANFRIDTGAKHTMLNGIYARLMNIKLDSKKTTSLDTLYSKMKTRHTNLKSVTIGNWTIKDLGVLVRTDELVSYSLLLGMDVLRNCNMTVDCENKTLRISPSLNDLDYKSAYRIPMKLNGKPMLDATINEKQKLTFQMDTGCPGVCLIDDEKNLATVNRSMATHPLKDLSGKSENVAEATLSNLQIGDLSLDNLPAYIVTGQKGKAAQNTLGLDPLMNYSKIVFDFANEQLYVFPK